MMVCGIMTDFCINATVEAGFEHGLHMIVPAYANSTQDNEYMTGGSRATTITMNSSGRTAMPIVCPWTRRWSCSKSEVFTMISEK